MTMIHILDVFQVVVAPPKGREEKAAAVAVDASERRRKELSTKERSLARLTPAIAHTRKKPIAANSLPSKDQKAHAAILPLLFPPLSSYAYSHAMREANTTESE